MKILSIRIKNLASLAGEHFIDFESEPLASAGLISIVGKTGAGKSTILDAMCLALFNKIPRLKDSDGKLQDVDGSELLTNSPLTVLRRGTAHGFAEVCFVAQDQKRYLARWELKRSREKVDGKLQSVQRYLTCLTDGVVIADKAKAVDAHIHQICQLSFEQFTRAVLLAQSEVTAFLKARDNERGELLEYLTNSSIFGKIGQLAYEKTKQIANQRKELENVLGHIELLSEEDFTAYSSKLQQLNQDHQKLDIEKQNLQKQQQWFEQKHKLQADIQTRQQYLEAQQQYLDALAPQKAQLQQLERFSSIRPSVILQKNLNADIAILQPKLEHVQKQFTVIEQQFNTEKLTFEKIDNAQKQQHQFEIQHQQNIEMVRARIADRRVLGDQLLKIKDELKTLREQHSPFVNAEQQVKNELQQLQHDIIQHTALLAESAHFNPLDDGLSAHLSQLQRFIQSYTQFAKNHGNVSQAHQNVMQQQQQLEQLTQQYGQDDALNQKIAAIRTEREHHLQQLNLLDVTHTHWQNFQNISAENCKLVSAQNKLQQQIDQSHAQLQSAEKTYQDQKIAREKLQQMLQKQRLLHTENIEHLRASLVDGEACLVCGSTHHPYIQNQDALSNELFKLQEQQEQQELEKEKTAFEAWQHLQKMYAQQIASSEANARQLATLSSRLQPAQTQLEQQLNTLNIPFDFSQDHLVLDQALATKVIEFQHTQKQLEATLSTHEQVQKQRHALLQIIQQTSQQLSVLKQAEENIQDVVGLLNDTQRQAWSHNMLSTAEQVQVMLLQRQNTLKQLNDLNAQLNQKSQQRDQAVQNLKFSQEKIKTTETRIENLTQEGKQNSDLAIQAIFDMTQSNVEKPHEWLAQFDQNRQQLHIQFNQARQQFDQVRQAFESAQSTLKECQTQQTQFQTQKQNVEHNIQQWLSQHTDFNALLLQQLSEISHEQEQQLKQRMVDVERAHSDALASIKAIQEQLLQHMEHQPEIDAETLSSQLTTVTEQLKQLIEHRDQVKLKIEMHQRNLEKQKQFADQIQAIQSEEHRWSKISGLMGDANGKKFRDYAQQYNLDILIEHANQQLAMLSQRYTLKRLDNSLSLAIIDHDMDGETRSVASLSGGESFLTALALSLAIANMASGSMKIESLFIDEGFGTLDASSLYMVMNALDQLQNQGRKVVLISHIQEMHERIPVQIQVKPLGAGASTIEVVG
ncbi:SbcC/MukB-like Walker B domain-containing protein [Acinetobacter sp. SA01]|uniref:SbcC/MukB-like Walker B domain-containing protein n=1 Tax=Acinetobacter sp. SA01 TaxID=1862567 RepID=UPI00140AD247|nr:SbcC/MukB-like Walker B domain-containing protein [Acinetobacter sp. SA01]